MVEKDHENAAERALKAKMTSDRASRAQTRREKETGARKRCSNRKDRRINIQHAPADAVPELEAAVWFEACGCCRSSSG